MGFIVSALSGLLGGFLVAPVVSGAAAVGGQLAASKAQRSATEAAMEKERRRVYQESFRATTIPRVPRTS